MTSHTNRSQITLSSRALDASPFCATCTFTVLIYLQRSYCLTAASTAIFVLPKCYLLIYRHVDRAYAIRLELRSQRTGYTCVRNHWMILAKVDRCILAIALVKAGTQEQDVTGMLIYLLFKIRLIGDG